MPTYRLESGADAKREAAVSAALVAYNDEHSEMLRQRLTPEHRLSVPLESYLLSEAGEVLGGCTGRAVPLWGWLEIDLMWLSEPLRGQGWGARLLRDVEAQATALGCTRAKLSTWEFQARPFYERQGYVVYAEEQDYPPGHTNFLMRKALTPPAGG
ncbi:GNAT family N-acetyltransferase [Deinococcus sp. HMF7604]|uniref:GNAT family N-acetyltransferase n=1 Tax=Deinococcus betulae TaxID=2873312 RepID=UPI001CCA849C|nr:GNAT family N-acetyltransferase [Deinococcus betulae]MBZ9750511.1 GNAT family N-acetyltransferase [Deinococcus betulae]